MQKLITTRTTAYVFYAGIAIWVIAMIVGGLFQLPYVARQYRMITPFIYAGALFTLLALCSLASGRAWRGHHRVASRHYEPVAYWIIVGVMSAIGITFLIIGGLNLARLI